jgi:hypothetical protein
LDVPERTAATEPTTGGQAQRERDIHVREVQGSLRIRSASAAPDGTDASACEPLAPGVEAKILHTAFFETFENLFGYPGRLAQRVKIVDEDTVPTKTHDALDRHEKMLARESDFCRLPEQERRVLRSCPDK